MTIAVWLNEVLAFGALATLLLAARGLYPHLIRAILTHGVRDPLTNLAAGFLVLDAGHMARMFYWDVLFQLKRNLTDARWLDPEVHIALVNGTLAMVAMTSAVFVLRALYYSLPAYERANYTLLTAPFYPSRWVRWRGEPDE